MHALGATDFVHSSVSSHPLICVTVSGGIRTLERFHGIAQSTVLLVRSGEVPIGARSTPPRTWPGQAGRLLVSKTLP